MKRQWLRVCLCFVVLGVILASLLILTGCAGPTKQAPTHTPVKFLVVLPTSTRAPTKTATLSAATTAAATATPANTPEAAASTTATTAAPTAEPTNTSAPVPSSTKTP
ncbi:MAG: hypothetical protein ACYC6L_00005, partial [Anaerolineae bacterium]